MSIPQQQAFLTEFHKRLQKASRDYRRASANRVHHVFKASQTEIHRGVKNTLERELAGNKEARAQIAKVIKALEPHTQQLIGQISANVRRRGGDPKSVVQVHTITNQKRLFEAVFVATRQDNGKFRNVYKQVYTSYNNLLNVYSEKVSEISEKIIGEAFGNRAKDYFNLEHEEFEGVAESQVKQAIVDSLEATSGIEEQNVLRWLESSGVDLRLVRDGSTGVMQVFIGSKFGNLQGAQETRDRKAILTNILEDARKLSVEQRQEILYLKGSDSFVDIKRKRLLKKVTDEFAKGKAVVILKEDTKVKSGKSKVSKKNKIKSSGLNSLALTTTSGPSAQRKTKKGVASSPLVLIRMFNAKLPQKVEENMQAPRLESRTGRFASSVRVVDVTTTAKGYPSFGYTYQRSPYGVYENTSGSRFASVERDPRRLIDTSMRELAAEMALGRFFTRRV